MLVERSDPVTDRQAKAIHLDGVSRGREMGVSKSAKFMLNLLGGEEHPGIGADRQRLAVVGQPACKHNKLVGTILPWEVTRVPVRFPDFGAGASQI